MGEGGWVGSDFLLATAGRVNVLPGQVGFKKSDPWTTVLSTNLRSQLSESEYNVAISARPTRSAAARS